MVFTLKGLRERRAMRKERAAVRKELTGSCPAGVLLEQPSLAARPSQCYNRSSPCKMPRG